MGYTCYVRPEGRGIIDVQPTVIIRFDQLTTITRNRMRHVFEDNYNPYGYASKPAAIMNAMQGHYEVFSNLLESKIMSHPDFDKEEFTAKALLIGYKFYIIDASNYSYPHGNGTLQYKGTDYRYDTLVSKKKHLDQLMHDMLIPIARTFTDHDKLMPIRAALENREPYTFTGINKSK